MKPENTERKQKREAVHGVLVFAGIELVSAAIFGCLCLIPDAPKALIIFLLALAALSVLSIIPALFVLKARFQEIEGGELDAAGKY